ncbi:MAG: response regulator transcription factor [Armatimonadetes bacterium]|nr:response regulator transcription factor [Armatimonadota bacterium]
MGTETAQLSEIRILLVDDHPVVCEGLRAILGREPGFSVVGEAYSAAEALEKVNRLSPTVVLMDVRMPGVGGLEATRSIKGQSPETRVLVLTVEDSEQMLLQALEAGADGFVVKHSPSQTIVSAVRSVADGSILLSLEMLRDLLGTIREGEVEARPIGDLTDRELEVLGLVAQGFSNRSIAERLKIAEITVKKHVQNLVRKLGARDRTQAAVLGVKHGIVKL